MSKTKLFTPFRVGDLELANRIVIAPMCQYSADDGCMTDWHLIHLGHLALSGAALLTIEATAVAPEGRITYADVGLWSDETEAAIARTLESVRRWSDMPIAIQLAHAGRKASTEVPWKGGKQIPPDEPHGWQTVAPSAAPVRGRRAPAGRARPRRARARARRFADAARRAARLGIDAVQLHARARLPAAPVPLAAVQPARRRVWRQPREPHALPARGVRRGARCVPGGAAGERARVGHRLGRGRLGHRADDRLRAGAGGARLRRDPRLERRADARAADPGRPELPGAARARGEGRRRRCRSSRSG